MRRKPWYWKDRSAWYLDVVGRGRGRKRVRLSTDREEAFEIWRTLCASKDPVSDRVEKLQHLVRPEDRESLVEPAAKAINQDTDLADSSGATEAIDRTVDTEIVNLDTDPAGKPNDTEACDAGSVDVGRSDDAGSSDAVSSNEGPLDHDRTPLESTSLHPPEEDREVSAALQPDEDCDFTESAGRYRQIERILLIVELLSPLRRGASASDLLQDVCEMTGVKYCERTIFRDLDFLQRIGLVDRYRRGNHTRGQSVFRWRGCQAKAIVAERMAEVFSERQDGLGRAC